MVTSGTRGLGRAIAGAFLAEGARVILNGRSEEKDARRSPTWGPARQPASSPGTYGGGKTATFIEAALTNWGASTSWSTTPAAPPNAPVAELSDESLQATLEWNLWSTFWCTRRA